MADFYDPISDVQTQWGSTGAAHYTEIDEGIRNPNTPTLTDYVSTNSNNAVDEWGFPTVPGSPATIQAVIYAETESKSKLVVSFQQNGVERATLTIQKSSPKGWYFCTWHSPSGDLSTLTIEAKQIKDGTGGGTYAYIYAAYLRAGWNLDKQVAASTDDCERRMVSSSFSLTTGAQRAGAYSAAIYGYGVGMRFLDIVISSGATIDPNTYITLKAAVSDSGTTCNTRVRAEDAASPNTFSDETDFDGRPRTDAYVNWDNIPSWTAIEPYNSPSIASVIQELVNAYDYSAGAPMVIFWDDYDYRSIIDSGNPRRQARSFDVGSGPWLHIEYTAGGQEYSITASAGSYAVAGTAVALPIGRVMGASAGDYAVSGAAVGLKRGLLMGAGAGDYAVSGSPVEFPVDRVIGAGAGAYSITGATVALLKDMLISAAAGGYALTGTAVSLPIDRVISAAPGTYALTGTAASLIKDMLISAGAGNYTLVGTAVDFLYGKIMAAEGGVYIISGSDVSLSASRLISAGAGSYSITGSPLSLLIDRIMAADAGSYAITGMAVDLPLHRVIEALTGSYAISGQDVSLPIVRVITADGGSYVITGATAGLLRDLVMQAGGGTYLVFGYEATKGITMVAGAGSYLLSGTAVGWGEEVVARLRTILGMGV